MPSNYVCLGVKFNSNIKSVERDYKKNEIVMCLNYLQNKFKNKKIIIITSKDSTKLLKKIIKTKNILFSKDIGDNFLSDLKIVCNSKFFLSYKPSGVQSLAEYTDVPYKIFQLSVNDFTIFNKYTIPNDQYYKKGLRHPWVTKNQIQGYPKFKNSMDIIITSQNLNS